MEFLSNILSLLKERENALLLLIALFTPKSIGFQYLEWWSRGGTHLTFSITSLTWTLTFSDWYFDVVGNVFGWLILPSAAIMNTFLLPLLLLSPSISSSSAFALLIPLLDFLFVGAVILYRQGRIGREFLAISGIILLVNSIAAAIVSMTTNVIFGIPPRVLISIAEPDVDTRFFTPIPILLILGWYQIRKSAQPD